MVRGPGWPDTELDQVAPGNRLPLGRNCYPGDSPGLRLSGSFPSSGGDPLHGVSGVRVDPWSAPSRDWHTPGDTEVQSVPEWTDPWMSAPTQERWRTVRAQACIRARLPGGTLRDRSTRGGSISCPGWRVASFQAVMLPQRLRARVRPGTPVERLV